MIEEKAQGRVKEAPKAARPREAQVIDFATLLEKSLAARRKQPRRSTAKSRRKTGTARAASHQRRAA